MYKIFNEYLDLFSWYYNLRNLKLSFTQLFVLNKKLALGHFFTKFFLYQKIFII